MLSAKELLRLLFAEVNSWLTYDAKPVMKYATGFFFSEMDRRDVDVAGDCCLLSSWSVQRPPHFSYQRKYRYGSSPFLNSPR